VRFRFFVFLQKPTVNTDRQYARDVGTDISCVLSGYYRATLCYSGICCRREFVRLSVRYKPVLCTSKRLDESSWVLTERLLSTYPTLCYTEISVSSKIRVLAAGTLSQTAEFRHGKSIASSTKLVVVFVDSRVC